jgi:hypothetical protein
LAMTACSACTISVRRDAELLVLAMIAFLVS